MMPNAAAYPYNGNIRYTLQRATGMIVFLFIVIHVIQMHKMGVVARRRAIRRRRRQLDRGCRIEAVFVSAVLRDRRAVCRLPFGKRPVDARHHLGHLDHRRGDATGRLDLPGFGILLGAAGLMSLYGFANPDMQRAEAFEQRHAAKAN